MKLRKVPIPIALIITLAGLVGGFFLVNQAQQWVKLAAGGSSPSSVRITNIDSSSFVVSWITTEAATGAIFFGETAALGEIQQDNRDKKNSSSSKFLTHLVTVDNLKTQTKYYFKIISDGKEYDNSGSLFEITTALQSPPAVNDVAQGRILLNSDQPASGALVYLSLANTITQAAITDAKGYWMVPLSTARTSDLKNYSNYDREAQIEEIFVHGETNTAYATLSTKNDNPTPDIILGQTYNFLEQMPDIKPTPTLTRNQTGLVSSEGFEQTTELKIIFPSESEEVNSLLPEFLGKGPKSQNIEIKIESDQPITGKAIIDKNGNWEWSPKTPLTPGEHTITVSYTDSEGFVKKISRSFIVLAAEQSNLPSFTATGSGQKATSTPTPSPVPTVTKILTPTPTNTILISPTGTKIPTPTPTTITRTTLPSTESGTPTSGTTLPTKVFFGAGIATLFLGIALILF